MVLWQIVTWASKIKRQFGGQNLGGWAHKVGLDLKNVGQKFLIYHWPPAEEGALVLQLCEHNLDQERRHWQGCGGRTRRGGSRRAPRGWTQLTALLENVFGDSWPAGVVLPNGGAINYTCCFFWQLGICNMSSTCWWKCNAEICSTRSTVDQFSSNLRFFWSSFFDTSGQVQNFRLTLLFSFMPRTSGKKLVQTIYISN